MSDPTSSEAILVRAQSPVRVKELGLVLQAVGIAFRVEPEGAALTIVVREGDLSRARTELESYLRENAAPRRRADVEPRLVDWLRASLMYAAVLSLVHYLALELVGGLDWYRAGGAEAGLIRDGEWWRVITALSLHSGITHLGSNLFFGSVFAAILSQSIGTGPAWASLFVGGVLGNLANAWLQELPHSWIGASTAVFAALGVQVAWLWRRRKELGAGLFKRLTPVVAGAVLFGMFGFGEGRVDVLAHCTGFGAGLAIGVALAWGRVGSRFGARVELACAIFPLVALAAAWWAAFALA